jgi:hypothetical protein
MKIILLLIVLFVAVLIYAEIERSTGVSGRTQKNGNGCTCHSPTLTAGVFVGIEGPTVLQRGQTAQYTVKLSGGAAVKGGFNVAAHKGTLNVAGTGVQTLNGELTHTAPQDFIDTVVAWTFNFTALDSVYTDTLYSAGNSVNGDGSASDLDKWNFGAKLPINVLNVIPVELTSFAASVSNKGVDINWTTATETNNKGFYIERSVSRAFDVIETISFVTGAGTTTNTKSYSFTDKHPLKGISYYRLKQVDFDGSYTNSKIAEVVNNNAINNFVLEQNYPNPFNPSTKISWQSSIGSMQTLKVYDLIGNEVATLINEFKEAGNHEVEFDAANLPSGVYLYKLEAGNTVQTKKMILIR